MDPKQLNIEILEFEEVTLSNLGNTNTQKSIEQPDHTIQGYHQIHQLKVK